MSRVYEKDDNEGRYVAVTYDQDTVVVEIESTYRWDNDIIVDLYFSREKTEELIRALQDALIEMDD